MPTDHLTADACQIPTLGPCRFPSPLASLSPADRPDVHYVADDHRVLVESCTTRLAGADLATLPSFQRSGPREKLFFDPAKTKAGIVTCGGLCPGINDVIRGLVMELRHRYGVEDILGFPYGFKGLIPESGHKPISLTPERVTRIHETGGTILGSSRGRRDRASMVDYLQALGVNLLFCIGGDGTLQGAYDLSQEALRQGGPDDKKLSVIGIPKTIDNDIVHIDKSFGFETAFSVANNVIRCAHTEAEGAYNGIGIVKLMGRESGFVAAHAALAAGLANFVLIPEIPFELEGKNGLLAHLEARLAKRQHACLIVAEGAGQSLMDGEDLGVDASGNPKLRDIGVFLKERIAAHLKAKGIEHSVKYIDPSYIIRSVQASPEDSLYCLRLAQAAVHAAMAGKTEMVAGRWREEFVHIPMQAIVGRRHTVDPAGSLWLSVLEATGQPAHMINA